MGEIKKGIILGVLIGIILSVTVGIAFFGSTNAVEPITPCDNISQLNNSYNELRNDYNQLQNDYNDLRDNNTGLQNQITNLTKQNTELINSKKEMQEYIYNIKEMPRIHDYEYTTELIGFNKVCFTYPDIMIDILGGGSGYWRWVKNPDGSCPSNSMTPMLDCNDKLIIKEKPAPSEIKLWDVVGISCFAEGIVTTLQESCAKTDTLYIIHQVIGINDTHILTEGTSQYQTDGWTKKSDVLFKVIR